MKKILIVDDSPDNVFLIQNFLTANNYVPMSSTDGFASLIKVAEERPDLIIMDMMMPNLSGADTVTMLNADPATAGIPVIFLSALVSQQKENEPAQMMDIGGHSYMILSKPFDPKRLLAQIKQLLA